MDRFAFFINSVLLCLFSSIRIVQIVCVCTRDEHYPVCRLDIRQDMSLQPDTDIQKLLSNPALLGPHATLSYDDSILTKTL